MAFPSKTSSATKPSLQELEAFKSALAKDGYCLFPNVVPKDRLSRLNAGLVEEFDRARKSGELFSGGGLFSGHLNCFPGRDARFALDALEARGILDLIRAAFPNAERLPNVGCNFNLPNSVTQHYHADRNFIDHFIIANVAVVDTDLSNGAIDMVPGTQQKFYKYWRFALERPDRASIRIPMRQGDVLVRTRTSGTAACPITRPSQGRCSRSPGKTAAPLKAIRSQSTKERSHFGRTGSGRTFLVGSANARL